VISQLEFLVFQALPEQDRQLFKTFCQRVEIINLHSNDSFLIDHALHFRINYKLKLQSLRVNTKRVAIMKKRNVYGERCLRIKREDAI
jgi:hypothetical protein